MSVSLSVAGEDPDDWEGLEQCVKKFEQETHSIPDAIHHAAGSIRYSHYDFFKRLALKHIAANRGLKTVTSRDDDLTDYEGLRRFVIAFATHAEERMPHPETRKETTASRAPTWRAAGRHDAARPARPVSVTPQAVVVRCARGRPRSTGFWH